VVKMLDFSPSELRFSSHWHPYLSLIVQGRASGQITPVHQKVAIFYMWAHVSLCKTECTT